MLRISSRLNTNVASKYVRQRAVPQRLQSSHAGGGTVGNKVLIATAGATSLVAGVVGYSSWSNDNRKGVENTIPGSKYLLNGILGPLSEPAPAPPKPAVREAGLARKKLEREKKKKKEEESAPAIEAAAPAAEEVKSVEDSCSEPASAETGSEPASAERNESVALEPVNVEESLEGQHTVVPSEPAAAETPGLKIIATPGKPKEEAKAEEAKPEKGSSNLESRLASGELAQDVENATLTQALEDLAAVARKNITIAIGSAEEAAVVIRQHAEQAFNAIDAGEDKEVLFAAVAELATKKAEMMKVAQANISEAEDAVEKLKEQISVGLSSSLTKENKTLIGAEEDLGQLKYAVENIKAIITESEREGKVVSIYRDLVESGREQFEAELKTLLPEVKLGETSATLTKDELNLLIAHAHRKVLQLQKKLTESQAEMEEQTIEHQRFKEVLTKQREEDERLLDNKINAELEKQHQQLEVEYKQRVAELRDELEAELRGQLKRQAAAHSDHLADVLAVQEKELGTKWSKILQDQLQSEKDKYLTSVAAMKGHVDGLKNAMTVRADVDKAAYAARDLWLACESLRSALRTVGDGAKSWEEQLAPLTKHVNAIKKAAGPSPYVDAVLGSISEEAQTRGVYTEDALRERFIKVERICKRVSMIGDNGGSLLKYLLSYVQSFLVLNAFEYLPGSETRDEEVPVDSLSVYDILARTRYCLDKDDLLLSVRYMNLLRGEARNVASNWLAEARLTLETRQAADALLAHAAATAVKAR